MHIEEILERVRQHAQNKNNTWKLENLEEFIISFEKNPQSVNEDLAKNYGNIIKSLVRDIMLKDSIIMPNDEREQEILKEILTNNTLFSQFNKLYTLILKTEKQKKKKLQQQQALSEEMK